MSDNNDQESGKILQFACDCVSKLHEVIRDPWSHVSRAGFISSESKELILNKTYRKPKTVTQLSKEMGFSQPAIHKHVKELVASDMLRAVQMSDKEKSYRVEQYYEPNFPVLLMEDIAHFEPVCQKIAEHVAEIFWENRDELQEAFNSSSMAERGYQLEDVVDFLYCKVRRTTRAMLAKQGFFPELPVHKDGSRWVYWAEEIEEK